MELDLSVELFPLTSGFTYVESPQQVIDVERYVANPPPTLAR